MQLTLGDQHWEAEGTSIKKAQHAAAAKALEGTKFPKPTARPARSEGKNPGTGHRKLLYERQCVEYTPLGLVWVFKLCKDE